MQHASGLINGSYICMIRPWKLHAISIPCIENNRDINGGIPLSAVHRRV